MLQLIAEKLKKVISRNRKKNVNQLYIAMDYDFSKFENDITVESGLQS